MRRVMVGAVAAGAYVVGLVVALGNGSSLVVYVPYSVVAIVLVLRRPRNAIGWLLLALAGGFAIGWLPVDASSADLAGGRAPTVVLLVAWSKWWWGLPVILSLIALLAILFPSGRLPAGRWRTPVRLVAMMVVALNIAFAAWPLVEVTPGGGGAPFLMPNPLWPTELRPATFTPAPTSAGLLIFGILLVSVVSLLVRYRRAVGVERLQLRWLVAALGAIGIAIPAGFVLISIGAGDLSWAPATISFCLPPIAVGVAVLRYRLYEIDRIISRTVSWAVVTGVLVAAFGGAVVALQGLLAGVTQGQTLAVAGSTLVAFALFQPLRRRVQRAVDHRFDRARYDGERIAAAFAEQLRQEVDLGRVSAELTAAANVTVRPRTATVWLRGGRA
jgi:hypothetical protein